MPQVTVRSPQVQYTEEHIISDYEYRSTQVSGSRAGGYSAVPNNRRFRIRTRRRVPKTGAMLVGWGGNNGSTLTGGLIANRLGLTWRTKEGVREADYVGSVTQAATMKLGDDAKTGREVYVALKDVVPMVRPERLAVGGWDISGVNMADAMKRAAVFPPELQAKLAPHMERLRPLPSVYYPDFIAKNQSGRADNVLGGTDKWEHVQTIRRDIRRFKAQNRLDNVIVLWTANTERFADVQKGVNDTAENLLGSIKRSHREVSQSTVFAVASILEGCSYINGSPQNTFVPGVIQLAERYGVFIGGDDFKSGQTKMKSVLVDFLVSSGIKPVSIVSYNHLGNNDGLNLSSHAQFRSKEISKSNVVDDMVASNHILYPNPKKDKPDHCVVIKYVPFVRDSKRAMDEYISRIFMGGLSTIAIHNTCEDSLLAAPLMLDLIVLTELCQRIEIQPVSTVNGKSTAGYTRFHPVLSVLSFLLKAPLVPNGTPLVNALFRQLNCIKNMLRACIGLAPENSILLDAKLPAGNARSRL